jgi:4-amino-4-deoxy-L-arabinose transferase-like glycosyltransferase
LVVYLIGREFFGSKTGFASAFIFSLSPMNVYLGSTIMADSTSLFFSLLSAYYFIKFKKKENAPFLYVCAIFTSFAVLTRYNYWALVAVYLLYEIISSIKSPKNLIGFWLKPRTIIAVLVFLCFFSPQLRYNFYHFTNPLKPGYLDENSEFIETLSIKNALTVGYLRPAPTLVLLPHLLLFKYNLLPPYILLFCVLGVLSLTREKRTRELLFLAVWFIFLSAVNLLYLHNIYLTRYSMPLLLPLSVFGGYGIIKVSEILSKKESKVFLTLFFLLYSTTLIFAHWLREDGVKYHEVEEDTYVWLNSNTEEDGTIFCAATFVNPFAQKVLERKLFYLYDINKTFLQDTIKKSNHTYFVIAQDGNDRTKNGLPLFFEVRDEYSLVKVKEYMLRLSMMSPWRAYTLTVYKVSLPEAGSK